MIEVPAESVTALVRYDGNSNGLEIHRDGRIFVADQALGLLVFHPVTGKRLSRIEGPQGGRFAALNDLFFAADGTLYMTDLGRSSLDTPVGRVWRWREGGAVERVADQLPYPNGLVTDGGNHALPIARARDVFARLIAADIVSCVALPGTI